MSKLHLVLRGGVVQPKAPPNPYEVQMPAVHFGRHGLGLVGLGAVLALLAPCIVLPSRFGIVAFQYSAAFANSSPIDQYLELLQKNSLMVLKQLKVDVVADMPKPPPGLLGATAMVAVGVLNLAAACSLGLGVTRILANVRKLRDIPEGV
jgi:hypothetical protein